MNADRSSIKAWIRTESRQGRRRAIPVVALSLSASTIALFQAWCVAVILASCLTGRIGPWLSEALLGFGVSALLRAGLQAAGEILTAGAGARAREQLRRTTMLAVLSNGPRLLRGTHSGALAALLVDRIEAVDGFFARYLPSASLALMVPGIVLLAALANQPFAALVLFCCGISVPVMQAIFGIGAAAAARRQFQALSRLQTRFVDRMRGIATIVLAGRSEDEALRIATAADELRVRTMRVLRVAFLSSAGLDCAMAVALVAIALHDGNAFLNPASMRSGHPIPVSHALFALLLVPEFFAPLRNFALAYQDRIQATTCAEALVGLPKRVVAGPLAAPAVVTDHVVPRAVELSFENVGFAWDKARGPVLDGLSFHVAAGETALLVGPSGAGKSTIIEMLLGFIQPDSGRVMINGTDLQSLDPGTLSGLIAWIGQKPTLFAGTLRENILFARPIAGKAAVDAALHVADLDELVATLPLGLETRIGEGGYGLSGGQGQRVAIARAMLRDAPLLLLDEPTAHLDPLTERSILVSLRRLAMHRTVLMASHSSAVLGFSGRHIQLLGSSLASKRGAA